MNLSKAAIAGIALTATIGCAGFAISARESRPVTEGTTMSVTGYDVNFTPEQAVTFPLNKIAFEGRVLGVGIPTVGRDSLDTGGTFTAVYTPVRFVVTEAFTGDVTRGQIVTIRSLGGTADGVSFVEEGKIPQSEFRRDRSMIVFAGEIGPIASDNSPAATLMSAFAVEGSEIVPVKAQPPTQGTRSANAENYRDAIRRHFNSDTSTPG